MVFARRLNLREVPVEYFHQASTAANTPRLILPYNSSFSLNCQMLQDYCCTHITFLSPVVIKMLTFVDHGAAAELLLLSDDSPEPMRQSPGKDMQTFVLTPTVLAENNPSMVSITARVKGHMCQWRASNILHQP